MPDKKNIFREESLERIESPEKLDQYIKVSKPSTWALIIALFLVVIGAGIWAFFGTLPQTINTQGITTTDNQVIVYLDPSLYEEDLVGKSVEIILPNETSITGSVSSVSEMPLTLMEIEESQNSQWTLEEIVPSDYSYQIDIQADHTIPDDMLVQTSIKVKDVKPIEYVLN